MGLLDKIFKREDKKMEPKEKAKKKKVAKKPKASKFEEPQIPQERKVRKPRKGETGNAYKILIKPLVTEKVTDLNAQGKYVFMIAARANKTEVKKAIERVYGVSPIKINIIKVSGKPVTYGRSKGRTKNWKKAVVTLSQGESLEIFEGV